MSSKRKSPYLILGVPFGASAAEAQKAFASAVRRLRVAQDAPYDVEDLNWALHAIEQRVGDPAASIDDYRMPADTELYTGRSGDGLLSPPVKVLERRSREVTESDRVALVELEIREAAIELASALGDAPLPRLHTFK